MAIGDAYATAEEYRARVESTDDSEDGETDALLLAVSRFVEVQAGRCFNRDDSPVTKKFDGNGEERLWLPEDIATSTALVLKCDLNSDNDVSDANETLTLDTHFWLGPDNAQAGPEAWPYQFIEVIPNNGRLTVWPNQRRALWITAAYGFPEVPGAVKEATIAVARNLRDLQKSGYTMTLQNVEAAVRVSSTAAYLVKDLVAAYGRGMPL